MKKVTVNVYGTLYIRVLHSGSYEIEVTDDMGEYEIEEAAKAELQRDYYSNVSPVLSQLNTTEGVDEWEVRDHNEEVDIEGDFEDEEDED